MRKVEPYKYRALYDIYPKNLKNEKVILTEVKEKENFIHSINRTVFNTKGDLIK
ncbi:hypothetical protein [Clostridium sp. Marseille-QA1073]